MSEPQPADADSLKRNDSLVRVAVQMIARLADRTRMLAVGDQVVVSATNFLTGVIIGRACAKEEFGLYLLGMSIVLVLVDVQTSLISSPYMVYSPRLSGRQRARYTGSALVHFSGVAGLAAALLGLGAVLVLPQVGITGLGRVVGAVAAAVALILLREFVRRLFFAHLDFVSALLMDMTVALVQLGLLGVLAVRGAISAPAAFLAIGIASLGAAGSALFIRRASFEIRWQRIGKDFCTNWSLGRWIFASGILWTISVNLYPWFLTYFHGVAATGVWAACFGIVALGNPMLLGIQNFVGPKISHCYANCDVVYFKKKTKLYAVVFSIMVIPLTFFFIIFGNFVVGFVYGKMYLGNGIVVAILGVNIFVTSLRFSFSRALFAMNDAKADFLINLAALGIMMTVGIWCVMRFGPAGVAVGMLLGNVCASIAKFAVFGLSAGGDRTAPEV